MEKLKVLYEVDTAFYHRFGYLIVDNIYQPEECDAIKAEIENHADADFSAIMNLDRESESVRSIMR
ncbi:MAG: phytanoyl-CoA dioxygenase family protein, partial [Patescibacteria group bacterium]